ncbi:hypothetical protein HOLleu_13465 [Holothuria leucospilota]|uniref:Phorbol-ester/DAG-type domain-containing protein n=1 Tax=Holothuria leucospilota TaxID=206669 RepID=A0A9Q1CBT6_HOLLE|nr:hypothetical protein HOLleu_13465 [Holothuria leucospilota]
MKDEYSDGLPPGSKLSLSDTGYINSDLFLDWLKHFRSFACPGKVLLLVDGHASHAKSVAVLDYARDKDIIMFCLPPHTTKYLQPLDRSVYKPLKVFYQHATHKFVRSQPGSTISKYRFGSLFSEAWGKTATVANAVNGFKSCGVFPLDRYAIPEDAYQPAETSERPFHPDFAPDQGVPVKAVPVAPEAVPDVPRIVRDMPEEVQNLHEGVPDVSTDVPEVLEAVPGVPGDGPVVPGTVPDVQEPTLDVPKPVVDHFPGPVTDVTGDVIDPNVQGQQSYAQTNQYDPGVPERHLPGTSNGVIRFQDILRMPVISRPVLARKRKSQQSGELTTETYISGLKDAPKPKKTAPNKTNGSQRDKQKTSKTLAKGKGKASKVKLSLEIPKEAENDPNNFCGLCSGFFYNGDGEEWVECSECSVWFHVDCMDMVGGRCDDCQ